VRLGSIVAFIDYHTDSDVTVVVFGCDATVVVVGAKLAS
jgi:hypothetical protein